MVVGPSQQPCGPRPNLFWSSLDPKKEKKKKEMMRKNGARKQIKMSKKIKSEKKCKVYLYPIIQYFKSILGYSKNQN